MNTSLLHFRHPVEADARMLLGWRRNSEINRYMYTDVSDDLDKQRSWLDAMSKMEDYRHFVIGSEGEDIGYLSYSRIDRVHRHCVPGFYVGERIEDPGDRDSPPTSADPASRSRRAAAAGYLHWFIMDYAFYRLKMNKVISEVLDSNTQILRSLRLLKEREVGVWRQHIHKTDGWHDVYLFELLRCDWETQRRPFPTEVTLAAFPEEE